MTYGDKKTNLKTVTCGVPQDSILGPLLSLIFLNDLYKVTKYLDPAMFADDTNLYSHKNIKILFKIADSELKLVNEAKTKYVLFHKVTMFDSLPLLLPTMTFNNIEIKGENSVKCVGVIIDETLTWKNHIEFVENKISKNLLSSFTFVQKPSENLFLLHSHLHQSW